MYGQEYRFSPAMPVFRRFDVWYTFRLWRVIAIILCPVHLAINYFYPENQGTYIGWVVLIVGVLLFVPYFLKYYKVEIKLK